MSFLSLGGKCFNVVRLITGRDAALRRPRTAFALGLSRTLPIDAHPYSRTPQRGVPTSQLDRMPDLFLLIGCSIWMVVSVSAQTAVNVPRPEEKERARRVVERQQERNAQQASEI